MPKPLIPAVRSIHSDEGLEALADYLPPDCRDVLYGLASGLKLDEALSEMLGTTAARNGNESCRKTLAISRKIQESPNFDLVLVEGEEELKKILQGKLDEWRIFLHPYQKKLVTRQTKGPMNINGSAGTGKNRGSHASGRSSRPRIGGPGPCPGHDVYD